MIPLHQRYYPGARHRFDVANALGLKPGDNALGGFGLMPGQLREFMQGPSKLD